MSTSYSDLVDDIPTAAFANNQTLLDNMARVIDRAQRWIVLRMDHDAFRAPPETVTIQTDGLIASPVGVMELRAVQIRYRSRGWSALRRRTEEMLETLYSSTGGGVPTFYAELDVGYKVYPQPGSPVEARVLYNAAPLPLSPTNETNVLTDEYPEVIRAASMREAAIFMGDEALSGVYNAETTEVLNAANMAIARRRRDETGQRPRETANSMGT